jgi:hypothetical protein
MIVLITKIDKFWNRSKKMNFFFVKKDLNDKEPVSTLIEIKMAAV